MTPYDYISIVVRQEAQEGTRVLGQLGSGIDLGALVEPEAALQRFLNAQDCYVMQSRPEGRYFSYIALPVHGGDPYMLTLLVKDGMSLTGAQTLAVFAAIKRTFLQGLTDAQSLRQAVADAGVPTEGVKLNAWSYHAAPDGTQMQDAAYRTYIAARELESIFSFPAQPEYEEFRCIIVVSATTSLRPGVRMPRITAPVKRQYSVICPPSIEASKDVVYDGDKLTLTYRCPGFDPRQETIMVGHSVVYAKPEGSTLRVRPADECGITFSRRVPVRVTNSKGGTVMGYTMSVNGKNVSTTEGVIELSEREVRNGEKVVIQVISTNYDPLRVEKTPQELMQAAENGGITLTLHPVEQGVTLQLDFGDKRTIDVHLDMERNTQEYNRLHSGRFHGYRANRQATTDGSEVYKVDLRGDGQDRHTDPTITSPTPGAQQPATSTPQAPVFENVAHDEEQQRHYDIPTAPLSSQDTDQPLPGSKRWIEDQVDEEVEEKVAGHRAWYRNWYVYVAAVVVIVVALCLALPDSGDTGIEAPEAQAIAQAEGQPSQTANQSDKTPTPPASPAMTPQEKGDADYLNGTTVWEPARMNSPMGQKLMSDISAGDIEAVVRNPYFSTKQRCTNDRANEVADLLWHAVGSPNRNGNAKKLKAATKDGKIDLNDLYKELMRVRPADDEANTQPRP